VRFAKSGFLGFFALNSGKTEKKGSFFKKGVCTFSSKNDVFWTSKKGVKNRHISTSKCDVLDRFRQMSTKTTFSDIF